MSIPGYVGQLPAISRLVWFRAFARVPDGAELPGWSKQLPQRSWQGATVTLKLATIGEWVSFEVTMDAAGDSGIFHLPEQAMSGQSASLQVFDLPWSAVEREILADHDIATAVRAQGRCFADVRTAWAGSRRVEDQARLAEALGFPTPTDRVPSRLHHLGEGAIRIDQLLGDAANDAPVGDRLGNLHLAACILGAAAAWRDPLVKALRGLHRLRARVDVFSADLENALQEQSRGRKTPDEERALWAIEALWLSWQRSLQDPGPIGRDIARGLAAARSSPDAQAELCAIVHHCDSCLHVVESGQQTLRERLLELRRLVSEITRVRQRLQLRAWLASAEWVIVLVLLPICLTELAHMAGADLRRHVLPLLPEPISSMVFWKDSQRSNARVLLSLCCILMLWLRRHAILATLARWTARLRKGDAGIRRDSDR